MTLCDVGCLRALYGVVDYSGGFLRGKELKSRKTKIKTAKAQCLRNLKMTKFEWIIKGEKSQNFKKDTKEKDKKTQLPKLTHNARK